MPTRIVLLLILLAGLLPACGPSGPGSVAGQIKRIGPDGSVQTLEGAQVILRGVQDTYTTVSNAGSGSGEAAEASTNYLFEKIPPGKYTMAVTPPPGSGLQPEENITLEVKPEEQYPQSVLLLAEGMAKPRPLAPSEMNPGEVGYINQNGERVVYQQGSGLDTTDLLLMYLLFRNPPGFGYGQPPIIVGGPSTSGQPSYRVQDPPSTTSTGQRVTTRPPSIPGQGATRPGSAPATGSGPTYSGQPSAPSKNGTIANPSQNAPNTTAPSQGVTRPSSSSPSRSTAPAPSRSSGSRSSGGRR